MANSDNVIRGGLTPKHIDIPALLHSIDYRPVTPKIIPAYRETDGFIHLYPTPEAKDLPYSISNLNLLMKKTLPQIAQVFC
ncbi:mannose-6-phosphate isomerase [Actinobacillus equuli]|nr:mannose-6-phosphate isomerase [Actinobacillus equuli]